MIRNLTQKELEVVHNKHTDLKRLLGEEYKLQYDLRAKEIFVVGEDDTDLTLDLFLTIAKTNNY